MKQRLINSIKSHALCINCRYGYQTTIVKDPGTRLLIGLFWSRVQTKCCYGKAELEVSVHLRGAGIYNVYLSFSKSK